jgi:hypothetical protein
VPAPERIHRPGLVAHPLGGLVAHNPVLGYHAVNTFGPQAPARFLAGRPAFRGQAGSGSLAAR